MDSIMMRGEVNILRQSTLSPESKLSKKNVWGNRNEEEKS